MTNLSIDIETYSSAPLKKCGAYRYAEDPDFEILLFGYSVDGGDVRVVDLACGETIPQDIIAALTDDSVTKPESSPVLPERYGGSPILGLSSSGGRLTVLLQRQSVTKPPQRITG